MSLAIVRSRLFVVFSCCVFAFFLTACGGGGGGSSSGGTTVSLTSLSLTTLSRTLKIGETGQLTVTGRFSDGSTQNMSSAVSWTVQNDAIVSVSNSGLVTALSAGTTQITATIGDISGEADVTVKALAAISIAPSSVTLAIGSMQTLSVAGLYTDNSIEQLDGLVTWSSSAESVAPVSTEGEVQALSAGSAQISAALGAISGVMDVTVSPATLESLLLTASVSQVAAGLSTQLTATGVYSDGTEQNLTDQVLWSVSNESIATVQSDTGVLTGVAQGNVTISATKTIGDNTQSGSLAFTISAATLSEIIITPPVISLAKGTSASIDVTAIFSDKSKLTVTDQVTWTSSDELIATITNGANTVSALAEGSTSLQAVLGEVNASLSVEVTSAELVSMSMSPINTSIPLGRQQQYFVQGTYSDNSVQDLTELVTWLSNDEGIAIISNDAASKGLAESKSLGAVSIRAVIDDIESQTSLTVSEAELESLEVLPEEQSVSNGTDAIVAVYGHYSDGSVIDVTAEVIWSTNNAGIIDISSVSEGIIHTSGTGSALLSVEFEGQTGLANINVTAATLDSIAISAEQATVPNGLNLKLVATGTYSDATTKDISKQVSWQSDDVTIASVSNLLSEAGLLRAINTGSVTVTASLGSLSDQFEVTVSDAVLESLSLSAPANQLNVQAQMSLVTMGLYSDGSSQDLTDQVNWLSSDVHIASIGNEAINKGVVTGKSVGQVSVSSTLNGLNSGALEIQVNLNPNLPKALNMLVQPNVILNNNTDSSSITMTLLPTSSGGEIADGTPVVLSIKEGETTRLENLTTINGAVTFEYQTTYSGFVSFSAESAGFTSTSGLLSTNDFRSSIIARGQSNGNFEEGVLKANSEFFIYLRNLSNRTFMITQIDIGYLDSNNANTPTAFPDSPITDAEFISDGDLRSGEFTFIGYRLDNDTTGSVYFISYLMSEATTGAVFRFEGSFDFTP